MLVNGTADDLDGVHVIHQLAQAGRTLVAVILNCRNADFRPLIASSIEGLRSCVGLLRRFSGRYLCGLRSADIIDEFCRSKSYPTRSIMDISDCDIVCNIPVDSPRVPDGTGRPSPAWLRPVRKRASPSPSASRVSSSSPAATFIGQDIMSAKPELLSAHQTQVPADLEALFNTNDYVDLSALDSSTTTPNPNSGMTQQQQQQQQQQFHTGYTPRPDGDNSNSEMTGYGSNGDNPMMLNDFAQNSSNNSINGGDIGMGGNGGTMSFDFGNNGAGFGGEMLAGEGMDTVSDGLRGNDPNQGL